MAPLFALILAWVFREAVGKPHGKGSSGAEVEWATVSDENEGVMAAKSEDKPRKHHWLKGLALSLLSSKYDCSKDQEDWEEEWSIDKMDWCCEHLHLGCPDQRKQPFDCWEGFATWRSSWADEKKTWCCLNKELGCEAPPSANSTSSVTQAAGSTDNATTLAVETTTKSPPPKDSCAHYGCHHRYMPEHMCQCNSECQAHNNCCSDVVEQCLADKEATPASTTTAEPTTTTTPAAATSTTTSAASTTSTTEAVTTTTATKAHATVPSNASSTTSTREEVEESPNATAAPNSTTTTATAASTTTAKPTTTAAVTTTSTTSAASTTTSTTEATAASTTTAKPTTAAPAVATTSTTSAASTSTSTTEATTSTPEAPTTAVGTSTDAATTNEATTTDTTTTRGATTTTAVYPSDRELINCGSEEELKGTIVHWPCSLKYLRKEEQRRGKRGAAADDLQNIPTLPIFSGKQRYDDGKSETYGSIAGLFAATKAGVARSSTGLNLRPHVAVGGAAVAVAVAFATAIAHVWVGRRRRSALSLELPSSPRTRALSAYTAVDDVALEAGINALPE